MRILYVEDNPANLFLIKRVAKMGEHEVINLIDGEEALRKIELIKPDLILMDIQLAGQLTGLDVVRKLRSIGHTMPIVAVTAYAMVGDRERCLEAGCNEYLSKPLPIGRVVELLQLYQSENTTYQAPVGSKEPAVVEAPVAATPVVSHVSVPVTAAAPTPATAPETSPLSPDLVASEEPSTTAAAPATPVTAPAADAPAHVAAAPESSTLSPDLVASEEPSTTAAAPASDVVSSPDGHIASTETPTLPAAPAPARSDENGVSSDKIVSNPSPAEPSESPKSVTGSGSASIPAIESTSQDTSHPQDTVQAQ